MLEPLVISNDVGYTHSMEDIKEKIAVISSWLGSGTINIFGRPFSGKDTHGNEIVSFLDSPPVIGGGDILRNGATPQHVLDEINKGNLAPTEEYKSIVVPYLKQEKYDGYPLVLSSVGRWDGEHISVIEACRESNHEIKAVIYLDVAEEEARRRRDISGHDGRGRHDDKDEAVFSRRLKEFREKTVPVLDAYRDLGLLIAVDAAPPIPVVTTMIIDELYKLAKQG